MTLPNFLVIGAAKAGTTSLYHYLKQHPEIYMSPDKEPRFFAVEGDTTGLYPYTAIEQYEKLFDAVTAEKAVGEASTLYLCSREAPQRIIRRLPDVKLIAVLRNPVERVFSNYAYWRREGKEAEPDFGAVVEREMSRYSQEGEDMYLARGLYGEQLRNYFELFPEERIRVYLYEDLRDRPLSMLKDLYAFLGVDAAFKPDLTKSYNITTMPDSRIKQYFYVRLMRAQRMRNLLLKVLPDSLYWDLVLPAAKAIAGTLRGTSQQGKAPPMDQDVRERLVEFYRSDMQLTEQLTGRDLAAWRTLNKPIPGDGEVVNETR